MATVSFKFKTAWDTSYNDFSNEANVTDGNSGVATCSRAANAGQRLYLYGVPDIAMAQINGYMAQGYTLSDIRVSASIRWSSVVTSEYVAAYAYKDFTKTSGYAESSYTSAGDTAKSFISTGTSTTTSFKSYSVSFPNSAKYFNTVRNISGFGFSLRTGGSTKITVYFQDIIVSVNLTPPTLQIELDPCNGEGIQTKTVTAEQLYGTLPTPRRIGYEFLGWYTDKSIYECGDFKGNNYVLFENISDVDYKGYTDMISVHVEAYMEDWSLIKEQSKQILSCTQSGGWGIGHFANTAVRPDGQRGHGTEININGVGYVGVDFGLETLKSGWHTFDIVFASGVFTAYVDLGTGFESGERISTGGSSIKYNANNGLLIGAEPGDEKAPDKSEPRYFIGKIANVYIGHHGMLMRKITDSTYYDVSHGKKLYAWYRPAISNIYIENYPADVYLGTHKVDIYIGTQKIYSGGDD